MPPAIHSTMTVSAVGLIFSSVSARSSRGKPAASAESVAALAVLRKSLRERPAPAWETDRAIGLLERSDDETGSMAFVLNISVGIQAASPATTRSLRPLRPEPDALANHQQVSFLRCSDRAQALSYTATVL